MLELTSQPKLGPLLQQFLVVREEVRHVNKLLSPGPAQARMELARRLIIEQHGGFLAACGLDLEVGLPNFRGECKGIRFCVNDQDRLIDALGPRFAGLISESGGLEQVL